MSVSPSFPDCGTQPLGLYPIVDSLEWVERLLPLGVPTLQLRMKYQEQEQRRHDIPRAIAAAAQTETRLFINDDWALALEAGAYGIHLGQDDLRDLTPADLQTLRSSGMRLGVSTHSAEEIAVANEVKPSYIAIGTVFRTTSKTMTWEPLTPDGFSELLPLCEAPVVAIGGINLERGPELVRRGANGLAVITAIKESEDLEGDIAAWSKLWA